MEKILSIIIPTYNMEKYLDKCLSSLIISYEKMQYFEVLVINDGSKDRSGEIAHLYEARYPQTFRVIDKENGNYGSCINRGLKEATGKYIKILDADDFFDTANFDQLICFLDRSDVDLIVSDYCLVNEMGKIMENYTFSLPVDKIFTFEALSDNMIKNLWHQGITYKTDNLRSIGYRQTEGISYTDNEWMFSPMINVKTILYFPYNVCFYLRGREGQTFDPCVFEKSLWMRIKVVTVMLDEYKRLMIGCAESTLRYLTLRLVSRCISVYSSYLIRFPAQKQQDLVAFDQYMKTVLPYIYSETNNIRNKLCIRYISCWRRSGYNINIWPLRLYRFFYQMHSVVHSFKRKNRFL